MAIRIDTDLQAVYIHEPLGHTVPALNTAWTVAGLYRLEADVNLDTLIVALYGTTAAASWVGLYMNADGTSCRLEGFNSGSPVTSSSYTLEVGRDYRLAIDYDGAGTVRALVDGVAVLSLSFTPNAGTLGERSLQWGGYGEISGYTSCTLARWRMWSAVLTEAEHRAEYRSLGPVRTAGLLHNWPMDPGTGRLNDTVGAEPDMAQNPAVPVGDGTAFVYRPSIIGSPQFFNLGETATPGAQSITVPTYAEKVAIFVHQSDDAATPDASLSSLTSNFAGTFTIDQIGSSSVAMAVAVATANVTSTGAGKTWTPTLANANTVAGAGAWVVFFQDVGATWPTDTAVAQATGDGTVAGTASGSGLVDGLSIAADTHLYPTSGTYPANESGWTSLATGETTGTLTYWASSRLRQRNITATGTESATTQGANGSCVALLTLPAAELAPAMQTARPAADISAGAWAPSTGATLWGVLDETTADDGDYISTASNSTAEVGLSTLVTPGAGAQTLTYRAAGSSAKALKVGLYRGATLHEEWTTDPLASAVAEFVRTLTTPLTDVSDLRVRFTAQDAAAPPTTQVTFGAIGTGASGTTSAAPSYPTGISASTSKLFCVVTGRSNTANTAPTMPAGWTNVLDFEGGTGTWGVDAGTRRVTVFQKDTVTGTETGTVTVSLAGNTTNNTLRASIVRVDVPAGYSISVSASTGADTTSATGFSATGSSSVDWAVNDLLLIAVAQATDTATQSAQSITASGITFGTRTNRASVAVTNGNDHRHIIDTVPVSAGSGSAAPTYAYTASAATSGPVCFLRLRAVPPTEFARVTSVALSVPAGSGGASVVSASLSGAWSVRNTAAASLAGAWRVRSLAAATLGGAWSVRSLVAGSVAGAWSVRAAVAATVGGAWSVRNTAAASLAGAWSVQGPSTVTASLSGAWSVRASASSSLSGAWRVRNGVAASVSGAWSVRALAASSLVGAWSVRSTAAASLAGAFSVRGYAFASLSGAWRVRNLAAASLSGWWTVRNLVGATFTGAWSVQASGIATATLSGAWSVRALAAGSLAGAWRVRAGVAATLPGAWSVRGQVASSMAGAWSVRLSVAGGLPGGWSVRAQVPQASLIGAWSVRGLATATLAGAWSVDSGGITPWPTGRAGPDHTAVVPFFGARAVVPATDFQAIVPFGGVRAVVTTTESSTA